MAMNSIVYYIVVGTLKLISFLPLNVLYLLSDALCPLLRRVYRRRVVRENLTSAFPEKSEKERREIERKFYRFFCDMWLETIKQFSMSKDEMMRHLVFKGMDPIKSGFDGGKDDAFCYLGHYGNWEWIASLQYWAPGYQCAQIYHSLHNKVMDRLFLNLRNRYGGLSISMKSALRVLINERNKGSKIWLGLISDQLPKWENIHHFTQFLNQDTAVFTGGEQMGKKFDAMMYYMRVLRPRRGYYEVEFIPIAHDDSKNVPDFQITERYMHLLEEDIRRQPELWLWTHKRWARTKQEWEERQKQHETIHT